MRKPTVMIPDLKSKLSDRIRSTKLALGRGGKEQLPTFKLRLKESKQTKETRWSIILPGKKAKSLCYSAEWKLAHEPALDMK